MPDSTCSVDGCERFIKNKTLSLCDPHYKRYWRTGDVQAHIPLLPARRKIEPVTDYADATRLCQICRARSPLESFHKDPSSPKGRKTECATCRTNQEKVRHHLNRERIGARMRDYRINNPELVRKQDNARYERDKDKRLAIAIAASHVRRARIRGNKYEQGITVPALRKRDGTQCHYCSVTMVFGRFKKGERPDEMATLEHKQAIARGGSHTWENCVLACWRCNSAKGAKEYPAITKEAEHGMVPMLASGMP